MKQQRVSTGASEETFKTNPPQKKKKVHVGTCQKDCWTTWWYPTEAPTSETTHHTWCCLVLLKTPHSTLRARVRRKPPEFFCKRETESKTEIVTEKKMLLMSLWYIGTQHIHITKFQSCFYLFVFYLFFFFKKKKQKKKTQAKPKEQRNNNQKKTARRALHSKNKTTNLKTLFCCCSIFFFWF